MGAASSHVLGSLVTYQIGYVADRCPLRQFQILISQIKQMNSIFKEFENVSVEKKTLSTALGFEPRFQSDTRLVILR